MEVCPGVGGVGGDKTGGELPGGDGGAEKLLAGVVGGMEGLFGGGGGGGGEGGGKDLLCCPVTKTRLQSPSL